MMLKMNTHKEAIIPQQTINDENVEICKQLIPKLPHFMFSIRQLAYSLANVLVRIYTSYKI